MAVEGWFLNEALGQSGVTLEVSGEDIKDDEE